MVFKELDLDPLKTRWADCERALLEEYVEFRKLQLPAIKWAIPNAIEELRALEGLLEICVEEKGDEL